MSSPHLIRRLLAGRNRLSRAEKDEIFARVVDGVAPPERRRRRWWAGAGVAVAAAAAALLVLPGRGGEGEPGGAASSFAARGGGDTSAAFELSCPTAAAGCRAGATLVFDLSPASGYRYFAAFARRGDDAVIWYVPGDSGDASADLRTRLEAGVLDRGVVLGAEHPPGRYTVFGIFSQQPLTRAAIRGHFDPDAASLGPDTAVVRKELVVQ